MGYNTLLSGLVIFSLTIKLETIINGSNVGSNVLNHKSNPALAPLREEVGNRSRKARKISIPTLDSSLL
jgi:hypothetical protein